MDQSESVQGKEAISTTNGKSHAEHAAAIDSSRKQYSDPTALFAAMQRRGRHRKSDAAIDAAIFSMLLSGRHLSAMTVHRELLKNPRYNLSERTVRRRMNEFFEFQRARNLSVCTSDPPLLPDSDALHLQEGAIANTSATNVVSNEGLDESAGCSRDTCDSPISSLQRLFAYTEAATASSDLFATDFDHPNSPPSAHSANEDMTMAQQHSAGVFDGILVKGERGEQGGIHSAAPVLAADLIESVTQRDQHLNGNFAESTATQGRNLVDGSTKSANSQRRNQTDILSESAVSRSQNGLDSLAESGALQGQNQAELVDDGRSDGGEELRERLEAEFASLSHEALDEFMREVELAVQQHRRQMAARAAILINELPPSKKRQLLQKLKTHSK